MTEILVYKSLKFGEKNSKIGVYARVQCELNTGIFFVRDFQKFECEY